MSDDEIFIRVTNGIVKTLTQEGVASIEYLYAGSLQCRDMLKSAFPNGLPVDASDRVMELGHPPSESIGLVLLTQQPELVVDGRVTVLGSELGDQPAGRYSFVFIVKAELSELNDESRDRLAGMLSVFNDFAGCLACAESGRIWMRLSAEALSHGVSLSVMGGYALSELRKLNGVRAAEVLFVVADRGIVERFRPVADGYAERARLCYRDKIQEAG